MTSRERVLAALNHREPDRVPVDIGTTDTTMAREVYEGLAALLGLEPVNARGAPNPNTFVCPDEKMLEALGADVRVVNAVGELPPDPLYAERIEDVFPDGTYQWTYQAGMVVRRLAGQWDQQLYKPAIRGELTRPEIDRVYPKTPPPGDWVDHAATAAAIDAVHARGLAVQCEMIIMPVTGTSMGILDPGGWCLALATEPELLCELMDRLVDRRLAEVESIYAAVGGRADMVFGIGDDVASQTGLWMSPEHYRRYVKPRHAKIVRFIKARTQAKIIFHCCGACRAILPDLIEIGVDVFNPTQTAVAGMDPFELKRDFGRDLVFWGGIDVQHLLPRGTVADVEREVKRHIDALAPGGGYILSPSHIIQRGTPPENVLAMFRTALEYGRRG
ncbi:MAG: uroporphyrinogen decarboxylase family protein [Planctomycetota bacterium]